MIIKPGEIWNGFVALGNSPELFAAWDALERMKGVDAEARRPHEDVINRYLEAARQ